LIRTAPDSCGKGHRRGGLFLLCALISGCGPAAGPANPPGNLRIQRPEPLPDPLSVYGEAGFLVGSGRFAPVGRLAFLPGPADSTFVILSLALSNGTLKFRRDPPDYVAHYEVLFTLGEPERPHAEIVAREEVRVATFRETSRRDESVVFQSFVTALPGNRRARLRVNGLAFSGGLHIDSTLTVPAFGPGSIADPLLAYQARPRPGRDRSPQLILSPRATVEFATPPAIAIYIEALPPLDTLVVLEVLASDTVIVTDSVPLTAGGDSSLYAGVADAGHWRLPPGVLALRAQVPGAGTSGVAPLAVSLGGGWLFPSYQETVSHLRYAGNPAELEELRVAEPSERARLLHDFLERRDADPQTPENEFLQTYLRRLQDANDRFGETGTPGWLTDRGAVYVTLGPPDEVFPSLRSEEGSAGSRIWLYDRSPAYELRLVFVDTSGTGTYRLTAESRIAFQRAVRILYP